MLAQEGPAVINVIAEPDLGLLVWESCWRRSVVCTGAASHFWRLGYKTRRALTSRKIFECTPYWRGTKSSIWPPQFGVHRLCHYRGNLIVIEKCYSWQNWKKPSIYSWSVKWKKNYWHWCMDARNLHCRKLRTDGKFAQCGGKYKGSVGSFPRVLHVSFRCFPWFSLVLNRTTVQVYPRPKS